MCRMSLDPNLTTAAVMELIDHVADRLPDLQVVIVPDGLDHEWLVPAHPTVYVAGDRSPGSVTRAIAAGLELLSERHGIPDVRPLRLVSSRGWDPCDEDAEVVS